MSAVTIFILIFASILAFATCSNIHSSSAPRCELRARTEAGWICGKLRRAEDGSKYASFRGVPYASPPVGSRRFKEPGRVKPWNNSILLDATEDAPACPHSDMHFGRIPLQLKGMSEDCLYLNIHVPFFWFPKYPFNVQSGGLPILVFIHEGGFQSGSGLTDAHGPDFLVTKDIIIITFNYRLNVFGFLTLNSIHVPGNQGLKDMVALLNWVRRNARFFGGDPHNVTLMGNSGGAFSAHILAMSDAAKGLFKRLVLMSSTGIPSFLTTSPAYAKKVSGLFLRELGINETDPVLIHEELIKTPLLKIMYANTAVQQITGIASFGPVEESKFHGVTGVLYKNPIDLIAEGRDLEFPMIISFTDNEMAYGRWLFLRKSLLYIIKEDPTAIISPRLLYTLPKHELEAIARKIGERYLHGNATTVDDLILYYNDAFFKYPALKLAQWRAAQGGAPTFVYQFAYELGFSPIKAGLWLEYEGATKMDDLACIFRVNSILDNYHGTYPKHEADIYMRYWMVYIITNFMYCSNPSCEDRSLWQSVSMGSLKYNLIDEPMVFKMVEPTAEEKDVVEFFDCFDPELRNITTIIEGQ